MLLRRQTYYKRKYGGWDALVALFKLILSKMNKLLWGYGEKLINLFVTIIFTISIFTIIYFSSGEIFSINGSIIVENLSIFESIIFSISKFFTLAVDITTDDSIIRNLIVFEGVLGVTFIGVFIAALFRYVNRR